MDQAGKPRETYAVAVATTGKGVMREVAAARRVTKFAWTLSFLSVRTKDSPEEDDSIDLKKIQEVTQVIDLKAV